VVALCLAACGKSEDKPSAPVGAPVRVDGSSTVFLISKAVGEEVQRSGVTATVAESGTSAGLAKFCRNEIDVAGASRPIEADEIAACEKASVGFYELPVGYDGLTVVVNRANDWVDHLTVEELRRMWAPDAEGKITSWKQVRETFPDRPLHLFGPGGASGTFDYFTQAIVGTQRSSRKDYTASEDDVVLVDGVSADPAALGYFGYAYYVRSKERLKVVPIDDGIATNGDGPIDPSPPNVASGKYQPLSRPIFIYVNAGSVKRPEVEKFVSFYLEAARGLSQEIGYVQLPLRADQLAKERFRARHLGTMFTGNTPRIGVTMERLLEAQAQP